MGAGRVEGGKRREGREGGGSVEGKRGQFPLVTDGECKQTNMIFFLRNGKSTMECKCRGQFVKKKEKHAHKLQSCIHWTDSQRRSRPMSNCHAVSSRSMSNCDAEPVAGHC